jgi:hypothetical protein
MQQRLDAFVVHDLGAVDLRLEHETLGVYQDVALTAFDLLSTVVSTLFSAHSGALDRLRVHHARTGLRIPPQANPKAFTGGTVDLLPSAVDTP